MPLEVLEKTLAMTEKDKLMTIYLLWRWWSERNRIRHGERRLTPSFFVSQISEMISDWQHANVSEHKSLPRTKPSWKAPPVDWVLINTDATHISDSSMGGWGCIAQDASGEILFAAAGKLTNISEPLQAETMALLKALQLAESFGMGRVIFSTDCLSLSQAIVSTSADRARLGTLFHEIKFLLRMGFIEYKVVLYPRDCNVPAHLLAGHGVRLETRSHRVWLTGFPSDVMGAVAVDLVEPTS